MTSGTDDMRTISNDDIALYLAGVAPPDVRRAIETAARSNEEIAAKIGLVRGSVGAFEPKLRRDLEAPTPDIRQRAWQTVRQLFKSGKLPRRSELLLELLDLQASERDRVVWSAAHAAMMVGLVRRSEEKPQMLGAGDWLWAPFRYPSLVLRVADPKVQRRDEDALIELARYLSWIRFKSTRFLRVPMHGFAPPADDVNVDAICFVGGLGLYGDEAVEAWHMKNRRFCLGLKDRPKDLKPGEIHPEFHVVFEDMGKKDPAIAYRTLQKRGRRTDYGVVQRYVVRRYNRDIVVLLCAGCSALGTYAAAKWAARDLFVPNWEGKIVPLPDGVAPWSSLEALIEVTADEALSVPGWEVEEVKLLDLRVDSQAWYEGDFEWGVPTPKRITLIGEPAAGEGADYKRVTRVRFDGRPAGIKRTSENFHLLVALCWLAQQNRAVVATAKLADEQWIWRRRLKGDRAAQLRHVKTRLWNLKRKYLGKALTVTEDECRLDAEIQYRPG